MQTQRTPKPRADRGSRLARMFARKSPDILIDETNKPDNKLKRSLSAFDLVLSNEMVGDLPAKQLSRVDIGLEVAGTGTADPGKVKAISELAGG